MPLSSSLFRFFPVIFSKFHHKCMKKYRVFLFDSLFATFESPKSVEFPMDPGNLHGYIFAWIKGHRWPKIFIWRVQILLNIQYALNLVD